MTLFASKTSRDLVSHPDDSEFERDMSDAEWRDAGLPWVVQYNEPNPILVDVRRYVQERSRMNQPKGWPRVLRVFSAAADYGHFITGDWERITSPEQIEHARKVLTKLAAQEALEG